jgi:hypothetical protein
MTHISIGNAAGFWGDNIDAPRLLCEQGEIDYLTLEYLAELTMSILAHQKLREPVAGFVTDFPIVVESLIPRLKAGPKLRIVTNAGGMNPQACAARVSQILSEQRLDEISVAAVEGDDLLPELDRLIDGGERLAHFDTGKPLGEMRERVVSANAYLGSQGIVESLQGGAQIVITGRVADASLTVGPCVSEFGWVADDWQSLAAATVAGHIIECGAQATGGIYSDLPESVDIADIGYPIAEISRDRGITITKPNGSGGLVTTGTVAEQIVYEIGDPARYFTPDVVADFTEVRLTDEGDDRVRVEGARGTAAPENYKVSLAYYDGYAVSGTLVVAGRDARSKAKRAAEAILSRVRRGGYEVSRVNVELLGAGDSVPGIKLADGNPWEVVLRISAHDPSREALERLAREFAPLVTSGPAGVTGYTGARPKPHRVLAYWPTSIPREMISHRVLIQTAKEWTA